MSGVYGEMTNSISSSVQNKYISIVPHMKVCLNVQK